MGLADVVRSVVATVDTVVKDLEATLTHEAYTGQDGWKKPTYAPAVPRQGVLTYETKIVIDDSGKEQVSDAQWVFLGSLSVDVRDRFTLPDGVKPRVLKARGPADPGAAGAGGKFVTEVFFGGAARAS